MRIGLLWHSLVSGNMGVRALTVANMAIIADAARAAGRPVEFVILGVGERHAVVAEPGSPRFFAFTRRTLLSPGGYWAELGKLDAIVDIGAGDSFAEIYGPKRFAFLWLSKVMAIARGVPLLLAPQTIGPFTKPAYRRLATWVMDRSVAVIARDRTSREVTQRIAPKARALVAVDVAFRLPFEDRSSLRGGPRRRIGINVSGLLFHEAESGRNRFGLSYDYAAYSRALLRELSAMPDVDIFLVPHATSTGDPTDDDGAISDRLAGEFPGVTRMPNFASASDAKGFISSLDFLIAARMHACIGAFSAGTPVLPVAYSRKFAGLFDMVDYPHILPMTGQDDSAALATTLAAIENAPALKRDIAVGMERVEALLATYSAELRRLFDQIKRD